VVWVGVRALTVVDAVRVRHVGLVIGRVEVNTIPTGGEKDLSPEGGCTSRVAESRSLCLCRTIGDAGRGFSSSHRDDAKKETDQSQEMPLDSSVFGSDRAYGFPVNMRRPSGKASTVSLAALRWR
jgi:hypothetical protein